MKLSGQPALVAYLEVQQVLPVEYSATLHPGDVLQVALQLAPTFDVVTHADWAYDTAAHKFSSGQVLHGASRPAANGVTFPGRRCREAVRTASFGRIFGGTASFTGRVFGNFAAG